MDKCLPKQEKKEYDKNDEEQLQDVEEAVIDYKVTNDDDEIVEGILDILPDGYRFFKRRKLFI